LRPQIHPQTIPSELKAAPNWLCCDQTKRPFGKVDDQRTFRSFEVCYAVYRAELCWGLGFAFKGSDFTGLDWDCYDKIDGSVQYNSDKHFRAVEYIRRLQTYTEVSPSRCGFHCFMRGKLATRGPSKDGLIKVMGDGSYLTVTGDAGPWPIAFQPVAMDQIYATFFPTDLRQHRELINSPQQARLAQPISAELWEIIRNGAARGQRSNVFQGIVNSLKARGYGIDAQVHILSQYPNGIAEKYWHRLRREIERSFNKPEKPDLPVLQCVIELTNKLRETLKRERS
jgi:hypothetical protein